MGPPFHVNLIWGQRFLQGSVLAPLYEQDQISSPRAIPVSFQEVTAVKKPGKGASAEKLASYKEVKKVLWQGGGRRRPLRLIVVAPTAYRTTANHSERQDILPAESLFAMH